MFLPVSHTGMFTVNVVVNQGIHKSSSVHCTENNFILFKPMITITEGRAAKTCLSSDCKCVSIALKGKCKLEMIQGPFKSMTTICISKERSNYILFPTQFCALTLNLENVDTYKRICIKGDG